MNTNEVNSTVKTLILLSIIIPVLLAIPIGSVALTQEPATGMSAPEFRVGQAPELGGASRSWTDVETMITICILAFGLLVLIMQSVLCFKLKINWTPFALLQFYGLTLVIIGALVLVTAGYSDQQIAAVIGLLGTIAGYLLGKTSGDAKVPDTESSE